MTTPELIQAVQQDLSTYHGKWNEKKGVWEFSATLAERKAFLSKKKLTYSLRMKVDKGSKTVQFSEMLAESGSGVSTSGDFEGSMSTGFGFKKETYHTLNGSRQGTIQEQSTLLGKEYAYAFDFKEIRTRVENMAAGLGYHFVYQVLPVR